MKFNANLASYLNNKRPAHAFALWALRACILTQTTKQGYGGALVAIGT